MSTDPHSIPTMNQLPEAAGEIARRAVDSVKETAQATAKDITGAVEDVSGAVMDAASDASKCATDTAKELYHSAALRAEETLVNSKEFMRRNPVPVVLGAVAFGVAIGYALMMARRKQTFGERYAEEPLLAVREAILGALAPVAHRVHEGYDSARDGAEKVMDRLHGGRAGNSLGDQIGRLGNNLKFW